MLIIRNIQLAVWQDDSGAAGPTEANGGPLDRFSPEAGLLAEDRLGAFPVVPSG
jgi:hypothetical protein